MPFTVKSGKQNTSATGGGGGGGGGDETGGGGGEGGGGPRNWSKSYTVDEGIVATRMALLPESATSS